MVLIHENQEPFLCVGGGEGGGVLLRNNLRSDTLGLQPGQEPSAPPERYKVVPCKANGK